MFSERPKPNAVFGPLLRLAVLAFGTSQRALPGCCGGTRTRPHISEDVSSTPKRGYF
jgi:hypothetical protein